MSDSEENHRKIVDFLKREFSRTEGRQCVRLELFADKSRGDPIRSWHRAEDAEVFAGLGNIEQLATTVLREAENMVESYGGGAHRFELRTEQHLGNRQRMSFRIEIESDADGSGGSAPDAPSSTGLVGQLMRHLEVSARTQAMMFQTSLGTMSRTISELSEENRTLRKDRSDRIDELEESRSLQADRDLAGIRQLEEDKRKQLIVDKVMQLLPAVAGRIIGGDAPGAPSAVSVLTNELADSLTPEQLAHIGSKLTSGQQVLLLELIQHARKSRPTPTSEDQQQASG